MLDAILKPRSIAVVGASRRAASIGHQILDNLLRSGFQGPVYAVNPRAGVVHSLKAYPTVAAIGDPVDLAVVVVPKEAVVAAVEECGGAGVKAVVVISAGFAEVGGEGVVRERALLEVIRRHGMRMVGPNCLGVLNTAPDVAMHATFGSAVPPHGPVAILSQSGAIGLSILDLAGELGIGVSQFVSIGNKPDVSGNDLLEYWENDPSVGVVLMYLESFGNPRKFFRLARRIGRRKPICVVKAGRTAAGALAASSHTAALSGADLAVDVLLRQCGVHRAETVEELFDYAMAFPRLPELRGPRVAIVSNAGGPAIILADACESSGLKVVELAPETQRAIRERVPDEAAVRNPVDLVASATAATYRDVLAIVLRDPHIDAVVASFIPPLGIQAKDVADAIVAAAAGSPDTPVVAVLMGRASVSAGMRTLTEAGIPGYMFPESAARALAALNRHRAWRERPEGRELTFPADRERVATIIATARAEGRTKLTEAEALAVLDAYGVPTAPWRAVRSAEEAMLAAAAVGYPVVLKVMNDQVVHKSDVGGVVLDLKSVDEVRAGYARLVRRVRERTGIAVTEVLVQGQVTGGRETIVGMNRDARVGPLFMFGLGGIFVEAMRDVAFRVQPVTDVDAREMIREIRGFPLLEGMRGGTSVDLVGLEETVQRVSQLVGDHDAIAELDVNPLVALPDRVVALDARFRIVG